MLLIEMANYQNFQAIELVIWTQRGVQIVNHTTMTALFTSRIHSVCAKFNRMI